MVNMKISQKRSKAMGVRFYWMRYWDNQKHFQFYWAPGSQNIGDYHTKPHQAAHHHAVREIYMQRKIRKTQYQGIQEGHVDPSGPQTARAAVLLSRALKITRSQKRRLCVNK